MRQIGFEKITGVDASPAMLEQARKEGIDQISTLIQSNKFPKEHGPYDVIICNWTLHFIKDKLDYIKDMYKSLLHNGLLFLTEKTYNDDNNLKLYHDFKINQGLTPEEIEAKELSIKNQMFINPPEWYINNLKEIGFEKVSIIDAEFCFTSFLAIKK